MSTFNMSQIMSSLLSTMGSNEIYHPDRTVNNILQQIGQIKSQEAQARAQMAQFAQQTKMLQENFNQQNKMQREDFNQQSSEAALDRKQAWGLANLKAQADAEEKFAGKIEKLNEKSADAFKEINTINSSINVVKEAVNKSTKLANSEVSEYIKKFLVDSGGVKKQNQIEKMYSKWFGGKEAVASADQLQDATEDIFNKLSSMAVENLKSDEAKELFANILTNMKSEAMRTLSANKQNSYSALRSKLSTLSSFFTAEKGENESWGDFWTRPFQNDANLSLENFLQQAEQIRSKPEFKNIDFEEIDVLNHLYRNLDKLNEKNYKGFLNILKPDQRKELDEFAKEFAKHKTEMSYDELRAKIEEIVANSKNKQELADLLSKVHNG